MVGYVKASSCHIEATLNGIGSNKPSITTPYNNKKVRKGQFQNNKTIAMTIPGKSTSIMSSRKSTDNMARNSCDTSISANKKNYKWKVGDRVDVKLLQSKIWHISKIIAINRNERKLKIHYHNLNSKYDEWLSLRSTRIRPINSTNTNCNGLCDNEKNVCNKNKPINNNVATIQLSNENKAVDNNPTQISSHKLLSSKKLSKMKHSPKASFVSNITSNNCTNLVPNEQQPPTTNSNFQNSPDNSNNLCLDMNSTKEIVLAHKNKNNNIVNKKNYLKTTQLSNNTNNTSSITTKTYHTRNINRRYSLDTIVVDESFNQSGILNNQGSYIRTDMKQDLPLSASSTCIKNNKKTKINAIIPSLKEKNNKQIKKTKLNNNHEVAQSSRISQKRSSNSKKTLQTYKHSNEIMDLNNNDNNNNNSLSLKDKIDTNKSVNDCQSKSVVASLCQTASNSSSINRDVLCTSDENRANSVMKTSTSSIVSDIGHKEMHQNQSTQCDTITNSSFTDSAVQCICGKNEDDGIMVQCEHCFTWQHGYCLGFGSYAQIPTNYICSLCVKPYFQQSPFPLSCITMLSCGYFSDNKLNQFCNITPDISNVIAHTFKFKDYVTKLKNNLLSNNKRLNINVNMNEHVDELFNMYNKLKIKSMTLMKPIATNDNDQYCEGSSSHTATDIS